MFTPSQLVVFSESPYQSHMDRFTKENPDANVFRDPENQLDELLAEKGDAHESTVLGCLLSQGAEVFNVVGLSRERRVEQTQEAMRMGYDVIYQAALQSDDFFGVADFLIKNKTPSSLGDYSYDIYDAKLATSVQPAAVLQLCCYADMLNHTIGSMPSECGLILGDTSWEKVSLDRYIDHYHAVKSSFLSFHATYNGLAADPADFVDHGRYSQFAKSILTQRDHLSGLAFITNSQIKKLERAGVSTIAALAANEDRVPKLNQAVYDRLRRQAMAQVKTAKRRESNPDATAYYEVTEVPNAGLELLPKASPMDIFFDIEGNPLETGGMEYLWGASYLNKHGNLRYKEFWAHNRAEEKQAFINFIRWVHEAWKKDPSMHVYHYAPYEITACKKIMSREGVMELEMDELLRAGVFVDLYAIVRTGLVVGEENYSIKTIEQLYLGKRDTDVANGADSVVVYDTWKSRRALGDDTTEVSQSKALSSIRTYNIADCESTHDLAAWLRDLQSEYGISPVDTDSPKEEADEERPLTNSEILRDIMHEQAEVAGKDRDLCMTLGWIQEFHRRENKPMFWRLFNRLGSLDIDLLDDNDCLALCRRTDTPPQKLPRARTYCYEYKFDVSQEFKGLRSGKSGYFILGQFKENGFPQTATIEPKLSDVKNGIISIKSSSEIPDTVTLIPDEHVRADVIVSAINDCAEHYQKDGMASGRSAFRDFLTRAKPRFAPSPYGIDHNNLIYSADREETLLEQAISAARTLDSSYLTIQGPPGTGKTYTGKHIIADLLKEGKSIGIASNSHKAINNLLMAAAEYCNKVGVDGEFFCTQQTDDRIPQLGVNVTSNTHIADIVGPGVVIGATAWGFSRSEMVGRLDYLIVDEAGQISVANLAGMSGSAKNIILMGDQQQLGQPNQGEHPGESGESTLEYLLKGTPAISPDMGIFLGETYRMHASVNSWVSRNIYDGQLSSHESTSTRNLDFSGLIEHGVSASNGIFNVQVDHSGNTQASEEEAEKILEITEGLIGQECFDGNEFRPLTWDDILFVTPFNHQVATLQYTLGEQARVGSVDKFQGQEAMVVILSMGSSTAKDCPRGTEFLLDKNRLNVAISRAQCMAIVVSSTNLLSSKPVSVEEMERFSLFSNLLKENRK